MKKIIYLFASLVLLSTPLLADSNPQLVAFETAQKTFERNLAGDKDAGEAVLEQFQALVTASPDQPLFLAYLGSAYTLKARDAWAPWTKMKNVDKGLDMIDKALILLEPKHDEMTLRGSIVSMETHLVAISTFLNVPGFLNRMQPAKDLLNETLASPLFHKAPPIVMGRLYVNAADAAKKEGEIEKERGLLKKAAAILPEGRFKSEAQSRLTK